MTENEFAGIAASVFSKVRLAKPLVHQITNFVVMNETANMTLCSGGLPVMAHAPEEVEEMVGASQALVLNIGTLWKEQVEAMISAGKRANTLGIPVVLDPVGAGATAFRTDSAKKLLDEVEMAIVRGNAAEINALAGRKSLIRGVESADAAGGTAEAAKEFARRYGCVAAVTGEVDTVAGPQGSYSISNGSPMMSLVTGTGCMASAVIGVYAAVESDYEAAAYSALAVYGLAGQMAADQAAGPGSFSVGLYDAMAGMTAEAVLAGVMIEGEADII